MPNAGHHNDMQHVWGLVEELSGLLQQNRERWEELQSSIAHSQVEHPDVDWRRQISDILTRR